jgi:hypothetical protein
MPLFDAAFSSILSTGHPYLNPGTGGLLIQLILGALFAAGLTVRLFWSRIKKVVQPDRSGTAEPVSKERDDIH